MGSNSKGLSNRFADDLCLRITPRTFMFKKFFELVTPDWIPSQVVESFSQAGGNIHILDTLPEAILIPLQESIAQCQSEPPSNWDNRLLALVGREDVNISLTPGLKHRESQPKSFVSLKFHKL